MKATRKRQGFFAIAVMALLLALSVPATTLGQSRSRGRDNGNWSNRNWSRHNRKCGKFVNCHDARDGRWDNRGPRGERVSNRFRRHRRRNFDDNNRFRRRIIDRDFARNRRVRDRDN